MSADFDQARKRLREKLGLSTSAHAAIPAAHHVSQTAAAPLVSVMHRVLEFEDKKQVPEADLLPLPEALSHSLSGSWKQLMLDTGKPAWQRDERDSSSSEVMKSSSPIHLPCPQSDLVEPRGRPHSGAQQHTKLAVDQDQASSGGLLLQLPEVHTLEQAWQQVDHLQQQAYFKTRKLNEAKFLARQAADKLLSCQMHTPGSADDLPQSADKRCADEAMGIVQDRAQALDAAQAHMLEVSEQVSVAELATELAEARASFMKRTAGQEVPQEPPCHTGMSSNASSSHYRVQQTALPASSSDQSQDTSSHGSSQASNSVLLASAHTAGQTLPGGGLSALRLVLARPSQSAALQQLSSILNPDSSTNDSPATPTSPPMTPMSNAFDESQSAPATPNPNIQNRLSVHASEASLSVNRSSVNSLGFDQSVTSDLSVLTASSPCASKEHNDCESTSGHVEVDSAAGDDSTSEHVAAASANDLLKDVSNTVLPPLPDLPVSVDREGSAGEATRDLGASNYVYIGFAAACLCVFAFWAKDPAAVSFSRIFPT